METTNIHNPTNVRILNKKSTLVIRLPWFYWRYAIAFFVIPIISFIGYSQFKAELQDPTIWPIVYILGPLYLALYYFLLTKLVNYTEISTDGKTIKVRHKPLPFLKNSSIDCKNVTDILINEKTYQGRTKRNYFEVCLVQEQRLYPIVTYIEDFNQAKQIQDRLRLYFKALK